MKDYQRQFLEFAIDCEVLRFGEFTLKSGRRSPYFFNMGLFDSGERIARLGEYYAAALVDAKLNIDMLYGPAYKGIPLVVSTTIALANKHQRDTPFAFNRKEKKDHGEGGIIVGAGLEGRVLIVDDVISAGTSVRESITLIEANKATPAGVLIALDRQERGTGSRSAIQELNEQGIEVHAIVTLNDLCDYLTERGDHEKTLAGIREYQNQYGV